MTNASGQDPGLASALASENPGTPAAPWSRAKYVSMSPSKAHSPQSPSSGAQSSLPPGSGEVNRLESPMLVVNLEGLRLHSAFQPIVSVAHSRVVGHEALLRGYDERDTALTATQLFPQLVATRSAREVNEACARLHLGTFAAQAAEGWLFLNVSPDSMYSRDEVVREFGSWLRESGIAPHRVVVEIIETRSVDECQLAQAVAGFRDLGCLVAIDDFGAGESNFERVWRFRPDLVKLDRAMISEAAVSTVVRRILPGIVSLIHEAGCLVVMEGIETEEQALIAVESDVDFVQGYFFSRPQVRHAGPASLRVQFDELASRIRTSRRQKSEMDRGFFAGYTGPLEACVSALEDGIGFHDACAMFLAVAGVQRVYELDEEGYQVGSNAESPSQASADPRFSPCADGTGANWFRRPYFQRAIAHPGRVQISRPYLSIRDARTCVTLSIAFESGSALRVLCADLDYEHAEPPSQRAQFHSSVETKY